VERIPRVAAAYARKTRRLDEALLGIAFACGGEAGARLAHRLSMSTSPDTLLRCIRHCPEPPSRRLRAVGIDDWAVRRGQRYGTIVCDLDGHCPVDVLDDRESQTVAAWLARHPEIEVITRDRAGFYIEGASTGAPQAMRADGSTLERIADVLTERGVPTKTCKSPRWTHQAVGRILNRKGEAA
jgi:hypothetical protein